MTKAQIISSVTRGFHKASFALKKHSPEILVVAGVVGTVTSAVMACKATTKLSTILDESKDNVTQINEYRSELVDLIGKTEDDTVKAELEAKYSEEDRKKDLAIVYAQTGLKLVKLYAPSVILGAMSLASILTSHKILRTRNVALAAAYATVDKGFKEYRGRVVDRFGKELDKELRYNIKAKEIEETVMHEDGTESTVTKTVEVADPNSHSIYARFFDDGCLGWDKDAEYNLIFLKQTQNTANEILKNRGYLYLNEVYEMLGIPKTKAGHVVGWIYDEKNPVGDNFVDFGIYDLYNEKARDFVNGYERTILLDFNVDGNIYELMSF